MSVRTLVKSIQDIMRKDTGVDGDAQRISQLCWMFFLKIIDDQDQELELTKDDYTSPIPDALQWRAWAADPEGITGDTLLDFVNNTLFPQLKALPTNAGPRAKVVRDVFEDAYNYMKKGTLLRQVINKINGVDFNNLTERQHFGDIYEQILNNLQNAGNSGEYYTPRAVTAFMVQQIDPKPGETLFDPACGTGGFLTCAMRHMRNVYVKRSEDEVLLQSSLRAVEKKPLPHMLCVTNMLLNGVEEPGFVRHDNTLARPLVSWSRDERVDIILTNPPFGGEEENGIESNFPTFRTRETADLFLALIIRVLKPGGRAAVVLPDGSLFGEGIKTRLKEHLMEECNLHTIVRLPNSVFKPYASIGTNLLFFEKGAPTQDIWYWEHKVPEGQKAYSMTKPIRLDHLDDCAAWWGGAAREGRVEGTQAWKVTAEDVKARGYNLDFKNPHAAESEILDPKSLSKELDSAESKVSTIKGKLEKALADAYSIGDEELLSALPRIGENPDRIQQLRKIVVAMAVSGKFDNRTSTLAPSEVMAAVADAKVKLAKMGTISKTRKLPKVTAEQLPEAFSDPMRFAPLGELARIEKGQTGIQKSSPGPFPLVVTAAERATCSHFDFDGAAAIIPLVSSTGHGNASINRLHYQEGQFALGSILAAVFPYDSDLISARFLFEYLSTFKEELLVARMTGTANVTLSVGRIAEVPVPLICPEVQRTIDDLMSLCDKLERAQFDREGVRRNLLDAFLQEALVRTIEPIV